MTASYIGGKKRYAELSYDDGEEAEFRAAVDWMILGGWNIDDGVEYWGCCEVEDKDEFDLFMKDWKEAKKHARKCVKKGEKA